MGSWLSDGPPRSRRWGQLVGEGNHSLPGGGSVSWVGVSHMVCSGGPGLKGLVVG